MADNDVRRFPRLSREAREYLEERVASFEAEWRRGERPLIAAYLDEDDPSHGQLLVELIHADLEFHIRAGEPAEAREYLTQFSELSDRDAADLVVAEAKYRKAYQRRLRGMGHRRDTMERPSEPEETGTVVSEVTDETTVELNGAHADRAGPSSSTNPFPALPGYRVISELARGGMGIVYLATEIRLSRLVAIKTVRPGADALERERLHREAEAAASLRHPNVVEIYRVFEHAGQLYVVCEYLPGGTLASRSESKPISAKEVAQLLNPIVSAVAYAHSQGIIHRDLKPSNILMATDGTPRVADFGLAKRLDDDSELTRTGVVAGSPSYMAPEQASASREVGLEADIWALGAILYELLTGRPPFQAATALDTLEQLQRDEPIPPRKLVPRLPPDLETICLKCLEKRPEQRYLSANDLADDLARFQRGVPVRARPVGHLVRFVRWSRRRPSLTALVVTLLLSIVGGALGLTVYVTQLGRLNKTLVATIDDRDQALAEKSASAERAEASERQARRLLFASDMRQAVEAVRAGDLVRAEELLEIHQSAANGPYSFAWNHLDRLVHVPGKVVDDLGAPVYFVCISPDNSILAACGASGEIRLYETGSWRPLGQMASDQGELNGLAFSPDGTQLASVGDDGTVVIRDLSTQAILWRQQVFERPAYQVAYGLDGSVIAVCGLHQEVVLFDVASSTEVARFFSDDQQVEGIAITPDGKTLVTAGRSGLATAWDLRTRKEKWQQNPLPGRFTIHIELMSVSISPDGRRAAFGTRGAAVLVADIENGRVHQAPLSSGRIGLDTAWNRATTFLPGSDVLAVAGDAGTVHLTRVSDEALIPLTDRSNTDWHACDDRIDCITACGESVVVACRDGTISVWAHDKDPAWCRLPLHPYCDTIAILESSHDDSLPMRLAAAYHGDPQTPSFVHLIDSASGSHSVVTVDKKAQWRTVIASTDGQRLFAIGDSGVFAGWDTSQPVPTEQFRRQLPSNSEVGLGTASRDGHRLVGGYRRILETETAQWELYMADGATGASLASRLFPQRIVYALAEDASLVAVTQSKGIHLLDPQSLTTRRALQGHRIDVTNLAFSRDGRRLASASTDQEVIVWDTSTGKVIRRWQADAGKIQSLAFAPTGRQLLTSTDLRPPRLWDIETGRLLLEPGSAPSPATISHWSPAMFTPQGGELVIGFGSDLLIVQGTSLGRTYDKVRD